MTQDASNDTPVSSRTRIATSARIAPGVVVNGPCEIGEECQVDAGVVLDAGKDGRIVLEEGARLQAGAIVAGSVVIARGALVQAGAVVVRDVPPHSIVAGNPAQIVGYTVGGNDAAPTALKQAPATPGVVSSSVRGVTLHRLPKVLDLRGNLTVGEFGRSVPFEAHHVVGDRAVPVEVGEHALGVRHHLLDAFGDGEHAHRTCHQFLICARGSLSVVADDGASREEFHLDDPSIGIHLPPLTWGIQYKYSADAVLLVFASEFYDTQEYIRDYAEFVQLVGRKE